MKGLAHDELTKNYYSTLKLPAELFFWVFKLSFPERGSFSRQLVLLKKKSNDRCISNYLLSISILRKLASGEHTGIFSW